MSTAVHRDPASTGTRTRVIGVDRWRARDAVASVRACAINEISLDAAPHTAVPQGIVPLAAGFACGDYWRSRLGDAASEESARSYHRRTSLRVVYGSEHAAIGDELTVATTVAGQRLATTIDGPRGRVATVEQRLADTPLTAESAPALTRPGTSKPPDADRTEHLARIRVARWVYISGELATVHGNHVAAVASGLPSVLVPASLLLAIVERALFPDSTPRGEVAVDLLTPVFADDSLAIVADGAGEMRLDGVAGTAVSARMP